MSEIFGYLASAASLSIALVGVPHQIYKNRKDHHADGIALSLVISAFITYLLWSIYGWLKPDIFLIVTHTTGTVLSSVLVGQCLYYRFRGKKARR